MLLLNSVAQVSGDDVILRAGDQIDVRSATVTAQTDMTLRTEYDAGIDTGNGQIDVAGSLTVGGDLAVRSGEVAADSVAERLPVLRSPAILNLPMVECPWWILTSQPRHSMARFNRNLTLMRIPT